MRRQLISIMLAMIVSLVGTSIVMAKGVVDKTSNDASEVALTKKSILKSDEAKLSYAMGLDAGMNFHQLAIPVQPDVFVLGLRHGLAAKTEQAYMSHEEVNKTLTTFQKSWQEKQEATFKKISKSNLAIGQAFLEQNKKQPGVKVLASGLQYKVITEGKGAKPKLSDTVTVDYQGRLLNGKEFDSSYKIGKPVTFKVSEVIPGWTEALQLMKTGATWEVYIPSKLAYGERGVGGPIGPNQTLIFKIHLIAVVDVNAKKNS